MSRIQQQRRHFLKGLSVWWETQTRAVTYNSVISALPGLYTVLPGNRGMQAMHLSPRVREGLFVKVLLRMSLRRSIGVDTWKRRERMFQTKKKIMKKGVSPSEELHLVRYEGKEKCAKY